MALVAAAANYCFVIETAVKGLSLSCPSFFVQLGRTMGISLIAVSSAQFLGLSESQR